MKQIVIAALLALVAVMPVASQQRDICPFVQITPERLPNLTIPRSGHCIFYVNGDLTVAGGHTTSFVPTPTAEYYDGTKWHQVEMAYSHDNSFTVVLHSGEVIIGGGHEEPLGIGQTFMLERYNPMTHTCEGFGCLDRRRSLANATLLDNGCVIISGNHYADDAIGCYDGHSQVGHVKDVVQGRSNPYILPVTSDDAVIIGGCDTRQKTSDTIWADRIKGEAFHVPLLERWKLVYTDQPFNSFICATSDHNYLLTATDESGQLGIVEMHDTCFSLLPTACPIPMQSQWGPIFYKGPVIVDSLRQRGYVMGVDSLYHRQYILSIDYARQPAGLTLYYTDSMEQATITIPVVTPDGDLILAGGIPNNNYKPLSTVWLYHFGTALSSDTLHAALIPIWLWVVLAVVAVGVLAYIFLYVRCRKNRAVVIAPISDDAGNKTAELMERVCQLMDEEQLYLRNDLKLQDVAIRLSTNSSYVSESINSCRGQSFSQFVNTYRVHHAQKLLRQQPDIKTSTVATNSGFSTEGSFFRNFKAVTGMTPREWLGNQQ